MDEQQFEQWTVGLQVPLIMVTKMLICPFLPSESTVGGEYNDDQAGQCSTINIHHIVNAVQIW